MEQKIAQFFFYFIIVVAENGFYQLIGLFNGVGPQALVGLYPVPRAFLPQFIHYVEQPPESLHFLYSGVHI